MSYKKPIIILSLLMLLAGASPVLGAGPQDAIRGKVEQLRGILDDPQFQGSGSKEMQKEKIREITRQIFDFPEISKRALAQHWRIFSTGEKGEFTGLFTELLENTYISKIQIEYQDEKVVYLSQQLATDTKGLVKTKIVRESVDIPVDYSMRLKSGAWWIYDVRVEGVSLVKNYRTQFSKILVKESPAQLIERLKKKVAKLKERKENAG